jgi:hypothetical protein
MPDFSRPDEAIALEFSDSSKVTGTTNEKVEQVGQIRDMIRDKVDDWCVEVCSSVSA